MGLLTPAESAELDQCSADVQAHGQVALGDYDEAQLLAVGLRPLPRVRLGHGQWPDFLGLTGGADAVRAAAGGHPRVRAAGDRLAGLGLAGPPSAAGHRPPLGPLHLVDLLSSGTNGLIGWFSATGSEQPPATALNGTVMFCRWDLAVPGVCLVQTTPVRDGADADHPLPVSVAACTPAVAVRHVVQAAFRDPLTDGERGQAAGTRCGIVIDHGSAGSGPTHTRFEVRHSWGADSAVSLPAGGEAAAVRRGLRSWRTRQQDRVSPADLEAALLRITEAFVDQVRTGPR